MKRFKSSKKNHAFSCYRFQLNVNLNFYIIILFNFILQLQNLQIVQVIGMNYADLDWMVKNYAGSMIPPNGPMNSTFLRQPTNLWMDSLSSNLYFIDFQLCLIRGVEMTTHYVTTIVGTGMCKNDSRVNIEGTVLSLANPTGLRGDSMGNLYFSDGHVNLVRKVSLSSNMVSLVAGNGGTVAVDNIHAIATGLHDPRGIWVDSNGNVFICDAGNARVRKIVKTTNIIKTIAGNGTSIAEMNILHQATATALYYPLDVVGDTQGNLYISDNDGTVLYVEANGVMQTYITSLEFPNALWLTTGGVLYITNQLYFTVQICTAAEICSVFAGTSQNEGATQYGVAPTDSLLNLPSGVVGDAAGNIYISQLANGEIDIIQTNNKIYSFMNIQYIVGGNGGPATSALLNAPYGIYGDSNGNMFVADSNIIPSGLLPSGTVRKIDESGIITLIQEFENPYGVWGYEGFLYVTDSDVLYKTAINGTGSPIDLIGVPRTSSGCYQPGDTEIYLNNPTGLWISSTGVIYFAETYCNTIRSYTPSGIFTSVAGVIGGASPASNLGDEGPAIAASLNTPYDVKGDIIENLFIADTYNNAVRRVDAITGIINSIASELKSPYALCLDTNGNVYVADSDNYVIRILIPSSIVSAVYTMTIIVGQEGIAGALGKGIIGDGTNVRLGLDLSPGQGMFGDTNGKVYFTDSTNLIREIYPVSFPTGAPSSRPSMRPSSQPTCRPSMQPTFHIAPSVASLRTGLVAYYPFDETANDKSGNGNNGIVHGGVSSSSDRFGRSNEAFMFDGSSGYIEIPGEQFCFVYNMSISFWMNPCSLQTTNARVFDKSTNTSSGNYVEGWMIQFHETTLQIYYDYVASGSQLAISPLMINITMIPSSWAHIVVTKENSMITYYLNGQYFGEIVGSTASIIYGNSNPKVPLTIGTLNSAQSVSGGGFKDFYCGGLDDIFIYNRTLNVGEVVELFSFEAPTAQPTIVPTTLPTVEPSYLPSVRPTMSPIAHPTISPSLHPTYTPTAEPTVGPKSPPTVSPSAIRTVIPTSQPSSQPSIQPFIKPSALPTSCPSTQPSRHPTGRPSLQPSKHPSVRPSVQPSSRPSIWSTWQPSTKPSRAPSCCPSVFPSSLPSNKPICQPSARPTNDPTVPPSGLPSSRPSTQPSSFSTSVPTHHPTDHPTTTPSTCLSSMPREAPSNQPLSFPSSQSSGPPTTSPSVEPSRAPSLIPTNLPSEAPSRQPMSSPSVFPSSKPSYGPTNIPTTEPTTEPTGQPKESPTIQPSAQPSITPSDQPVSIPSAQPSHQPSLIPSSHLTQNPNIHPSLSPSIRASKSSLPFPSFTPSHAQTTSVNLSVTNMVTNNSRQGFKVSLFFITNVKYSLTNLKNIVLPGNNQYGNNYIIFGRKSLPTSLSLDDTDDLAERQYYVPLNNGLSIEALPRSVAVAGDVNGDGVEDILLGDPYNGRAYVLFGKQGNDTDLWKDMPIGMTLTPSSSYDYLGWSVSTAGDFNGDGLTDMIIGAIQSNRCYIIYGNSSLPVSLVAESLGEEKKGLIVLGDSSVIELLGLAVSGGYDYNGDGFDDVIISALSSVTASSTVVYILYGGKAMSSRGSVTVESGIVFGEEGMKIVPPVWSFGGMSISMVGDMNGDEYGDIVIGSVPYSQGYTTQISYVVYGRNNSKASNERGVLDLSSFSGDEGMKIIGGGLVVSGVRDVNRDGYDDVMITWYDGWQGQNGAYLVEFPEIGSVTVAPTEYPSSQPSIHTVLTQQPTLLLTAKATTPTFVPSFAPSGPSKVPTLEPVPPTILPSFRKTITPSANPSHQSITPTFSPSTLRTRSPTHKPSSFVPSHSFSLHPTTFTPSASFMTSFSPIQYNNITYINKGGLYNEQNRSGNVEFLITTATDTTIIINPHEFQRKGRFTYKIFNNNTIASASIVMNNNTTTSFLSPAAGRGAMTILTITEFDSSLDILDISSFPSLISISCLSYSTNPLLIVLTGYTKTISLPSHSLFDLTNGNFIFAPMSSSSSSSSINEAASSLLSIGTFTPVLVLLILGLVMVLFLLFVDSLRRKEETVEKVKEDLLPLRQPSLSLGQREMIVIENSNDGNIRGTETMVRNNIDAISVYSDSSHSSESFQYLPLHEDEEVDEKVIYKKNSDSSSELEEDPSLSSNTQVSSSLGSLSLYSEESVETESDFSS